MLYTLAARALLMITDHGVTMFEAVEWVTRRVPANLKNYYTFMLLAMVSRELP